MTNIDEVEALALAAGLLYRKRHKETAHMVLALATDIVLKQDDAEQPAYMSNLDKAYNKGRNACS